MCVHEYVCVYEYVCVCVRACVCACACVCVCAEAKKSIIMEATKQTRPGTGKGRAFEIEMHQAR